MIHHRDIFHNTLLVKRLEGLPRKTAAMPPQTGISRLLSKFFLFNVICIVLFWIVRIGLLSNANTQKHFQSVSDTQESLHASPIHNALYMSAMTQTTVGASDITPISHTAKAVTWIQALTALGSVLVLIVSFNQVTRVTL